DIIDRYYGWLTGFCWIFPLAFAVPVAVMNLSKFPGIGFSCLVSTDNLNTYIFYPIAVYIYPAMLVHIVTVAKMIQLAVMSSKIDNGLSQLSSNSRMNFSSTMQAKRLLRGQWRPALMLFMTMACITIFWLFYFIEGHRLALITPQTRWVIQWYICLTINHRKGLSPDETQTICAQDVAQHLPSLPWLAAAELVLAIIGVVVTLVFISKVEFWSEWASVLSDFFTRGSGKRKPRRGSDASDPKAPPMERGFSNSSQQSFDPNVRKATAARLGYNDTLPGDQPVHGGDLKKELRNINDNTGEMQWVDMDDLLDKEYELQDTNMPTSPLASGQLTTAELSLTMADSSPRDYHSNEIMYSPEDPNHQWMSSPSSPGYMVPNDDNDLYPDHQIPTMPRVPRPSISKSKQLHEPIYLSSPSTSSRFVQPPQNISGQLSSASLPRGYHDPGHFAGGSGVHESPTMAYAQTMGSSTPSMKTSPQTSSEIPSIKGMSTNLYNSNDSMDRYAMSSRDNLNRVPKNNMNMESSSSLGRSNSGRNNRTIPTALDTKATSSKPSIPLKSPARLLSPTGSSPTSPTQLYPDQQQHEFR
ncbi:hypothetical protein BGX31_004306, partial [Mortierella sp. GBA43]